MYVLFQILLVVAFWVLMVVLGGAVAMSGGSFESMLGAGGAVLLLAAVYGLVELALVIPSLAVSVRRLHDTNRSGWWLVSPLAPYLLVFVGLSVVTSGANPGGAAALLIILGGFGAFALWVLVFIFTLLEGTKGPNRFGADPKDTGHQEVFA